VEREEEPPRNRASPDSRRSTDRLFLAELDQDSTILEGQGQDGAMLQQTTSIRFRAGTINGPRRNKQAKTINLAWFQILQAVLEQLA